MTENEAIKQFEERIEYWGGNESEAQDYIEAMKVAVSALKEIQQYHATGMTPEQIKEMQVDYVVKSQLFEEYRSIGTVNGCKETAEKEKPMSPISDHGETWIYPVCHSADVVTQDEYGKDNGFLNYCGNCGQKLDWSETA